MYIGLFLDRALICFLKKTKLSKSNTLTKHYSDFKYLSQSIIDTLKGNNNELLGGFPHSEIVGSKPILGLPTLIAEYHVLHRLLLPRHPPNALLALDLIQKKSD